MRIRKIKLKYQEVLVGNIYKKEIFGKVVYNLILSRDINFEILQKFKNTSFP